MDCREVMDLLDAYSLGALDRAAATPLEEHVADCVRCWEELDEAQRAAALLAFGVQMQTPPTSLRTTVLGRAQREERRERAFAGIRRALPKARPAVLGGLAAAVVGALALTAFLQLEMNDIREENDSLERQLEASSELLGLQPRLASLLTEPDVREIDLPATSPQSEALAVYYWSRYTRKGFVVGNNLPPLQSGQVYQVWLVTGDRAVSAGTFESWNGVAMVPIDLTVIDRRPDAIAVTIEESGGVDSPSGATLLRASMSDE